MTALQRRFHIASERTVELGHDVETAYNALRETLTREQKKLLLCGSATPKPASAAKKSWTASSPASDWRTASIANLAASRRTRSRTRMNKAWEIFEQEIAETTDD